MKKNKITTSVFMEVDVIKEATEYAQTIDRSFSWYVNDLVKHDLEAISFSKANKMIDKS